MSRRNASTTFHLQSTVMKQQPPLDTTALVADQRILALSRSGCSPQIIYAALWPEGNANVPAHVFPDVVRALEAADATRMPDEELPKDLEDAVDDLLVARRFIMRDIEAAAESEEGFNAGAHMALCKNADVLLKYQAARQERQIHVLNVRTAQEKARIELMDMRSEGN